MSLHNLVNTYLFLKIIQILLKKIQFSGVCVPCTVLKKPLFFKLCCGRISMRTFVCVWIHGGCAGDIIS